MKSGSKRNCWWSDHYLVSGDGLAAYVERDKNIYNTRYIVWHLLYDWLMEKWGGKRTGEILSDALINIDLDKFDCQS